MVIFDCNGVLVDSEPIVSAVLAESLTRAGFPANADGLARRYHGRRPADVFASVEAGHGQKAAAEFRRPRLRPRPCAVSAPSCARCPMSPMR